MNRLIRKLSFALLAAGAVALIGCKSEEKPATAPSEAASMGAGTTTLVTRPGEAGGVAESSFDTVVTVQAIDSATRQVTLVDTDGTKATFIAGPEIKNFDQMKVGDKVRASFKERMAVFVRSDGASPSMTHAAALASAPKGAKPGAMVGQAYEIVATVKAIDPDARIATLQFADGQQRKTPVRPDVELSRYAVGDSVVIQVSESLSVMVEAP